MKKMTMLLMAVMMLVTTGCGGKQNGPGQGGGESQYADALEVLSGVVKVYGENELFAMYGGDQENAVMDAPGKFDVTKTEELESVLGIPQIGRAHV